MTQKHPFQWHIVKDSGVAIDSIQPYICFSRLRGFDKILYLYIADAIARRDDLNSVEQWHKHWLPSAIEKYQSEAYSEEFLAGLCPVES